MEITDSPVILIVDDAPGNIDVLAGILSPHYKLRAARDGVKALESVERNPPDLILLDIMMPGIDGYEVCRLLKQNPKTRSIPVLFVTAMSEDVDEAKGFDVGALDYLTKPVSPLVVLARVKTYLALAKAQQESDKQRETLQEIIRLREDVERITSHDLKSPLTAFINIPLMLMRDKNQTPDQVEMLEILHKSGFCMLEMINRSLDLYKMERGEYHLNPVLVDVARIIRDIFSELGCLVFAQKVKTSFWIDGSLATETSECFFLGEEFLFFSMLANLIKNAIEASTEGKEVWVHLHSLVGRSIEIKNEGEIPPEIRERFLERFVTFGKKGTIGLGVYSARLMAKTLGGEFRFTSTKETGTLVTIDLAVDQKQALQPLPIEEETSVLLKPRSEMVVLVVDDYIYMRKILGDILHQMGFGKVREAGSVLEAQSFLEKEPLDLIVSDWDLPDKTGMVLLRAVRSRPDGEKIPFIIVTRSASEESLAMSRKSALTDVLAKPFSPDVLKRRIEALFSQNRSQA